MTGQTIITQALVEMGVYSPGETPSASDSSFGLSCLNLMLDTWSGARDLAYEIAIAAFALTNTQTFPIGPTATAPFNVPRPIKIETATIVLTAIGGKGMRFELKMIPQEEWAEIADQGASGTVPDKMYLDPSVPNAVINLHPIPLCVTATSIELGTWTVIQQFATLATNANLPPSYFRAIVLGLQLELIPTYGNIISPQIVQLRASQFKEAIAIVRNLNAEIQLQQLTPAANPQSQGKAAQQEQASAVRESE